MNLPFFAVKAHVPGGVQNQAEKNSKNAFRPVPVQKFTFPVLVGRTKNCSRNVQKRPDVHKIVLSIKPRSPPPAQQASILRIFYWFE